MSRATRRLTWVLGLAVIGAALGAWLVLRPSLPVPDPDLTAMQPAVARALEQARQGVLDDRESAEYWGAFGAVLDAHELYDPAAVCYARARTLAPEDFRWAYFLAIVEDFRGADLDRIVETFEEALELNPDYTALRFRYGDALARQGQLERARDEYARSIELQPNLAVGHRALGQLLISLGDAATAVRHLERSAQLNPNDGKVYVALARGYTMLEQHERAAEAEQRSRGREHKRILPDPIRLYVARLAADPASIISRAQNAIDRGAFDEAIPDLKRFLEAAPDHAAAHLLLGHCYAQIRRTGEARQEMTEALRLDDELWEAHLQLAGLLAMDGQMDAAVRHFRRALEGDPDNSEAHAKLGLALGMSGDLDGAVESFETAVALSPENVGYVYNLGTAQMRNGDYASAVRQFRRAHELRPDAPDTLLYLGAALERLDRVDEAIEAYRRAADLDPDHRAAQRLRQLNK